MRDGGHRIAHWRCFWTWPFGHYWQPGLGCDGHPAYVCRDCPKAVSQFGDMDVDVSPKRPGVAERRFYCGKWANRYPASVAPSREQVLEVMLGQAVSTIEFLHGCLTDHVFSYDYPAQTLQWLKDFHAILPPREWCVHSKTVPGCAGCADGIRARSVMAAWRDSLPGGTTS